MREIKFRFWDKENKKMIYGAEETYDYGASGVPIMEDNFGLLLENSGEYIMQYVGVKDKYGKEIYEGDIVKTKLKSIESDFIKTKDHIFTIVYSELWRAYGLIDTKNSFFSLWRFSEKLIKMIKDEAVFCDNRDFFENDLEIIGNIYENPELLERKK